MNADDSIISGEHGKPDNKEDKVVVEPKVKSDTCGVQGGLVLDGRGKVLSVGANVTAVKPGDEVTFDQTAGQDVLLFGKVLKILQENEVTPAVESES